MTIWVESLANHKMMPNQKWYIIHNGKNLENYALKEVANYLAENNH